MNRPNEQSDGTLQLEDPAPDAPTRPRFDFHAVSTAATSNRRLQLAVQNGVVRNDRAREVRLGELPDSDRLRALAGEIKQHTLDYLDFYLQQFADNFTRRGGKVHFASTADEARSIILGICRDENARRVIKSKSMASEEIDLAQVMEAAGIDVVETDLGEFIIQIDHDKPSHIVTPIIHKDKASIAELFSRYFNTPYDDDPVHLTMQARRYLREKFRDADLGMTGGNFLVAQTGDICIVENEGNARHSTSSPRVLISLVGVEKVIPRTEDLAVMLKLLARSATGQPMTVYTSLFGQPRAAGESDGPDSVHVVLIDNGRVQTLASEEYREVLRCIRCGACLNACPIYRNIGGHAYGSVYPGPIGALITPLFQGLDKHKDLPQASSLCGACYDACPVKINIPKHLINLRRDIQQRRISSRAERFIYRRWAWMMKRRFWYGVMTRVQKLTLRMKARDGFIKRVPPPGGGWTKIRDMPAPAKQTFRQTWAKRRK